MLGISLLFAIVFGIPLGFFLFITDKGLFFENRIINVVGGLLVNVIRSVPFVILLVLLLPSDAVRHRLDHRPQGRIGAVVRGRDRVLRAARGIIAARSRPRRH